MLDASGQRIARASQILPALPLRCVSPKAKRDPPRQVGGRRLVILGMKPFSRIATAVISKLVIVLRLRIALKIRFP